MIRPEILSPAGDFEKLKSAVYFGADAVYLAGSHFGMRAASSNFTNEELREAVEFCHSRGVKLYVTVNIMPRDGEYAPLREFLTYLGEIGVDAAEQFLPWWDFEGSAEVKAKNTTKVAVMLDECIHNIYDAERAGRLDAADYFNIKLMKCGGLYYGAQIADIAEKYGKQCMVGCMQENKISITAGVSLVAAKKSIVEADCDSFMFYLGDDDGIVGGFERDGGVFTLLDKPGFGIEMDF